MDGPTLTADRLLTEIAAAFDYLFYVSPTDTEAAWVRFAADDCKTEPEFTYRPIDMDLDDLHRRLDTVPIDEVDDDVGDLLRGKLDEQRALLHMLAARGTPAFLEHGRTVFGSVSDALVGLARGVLDDVGTEIPDAGATVPPEVFVREAEASIAAYREQDPQLPATVGVRDDIDTLMVTRHEVLVPTTRRIAERRVEPLVHHEVGVHILTWWNGMRQPLGLLADGLAAYQETQEGLGVLAEHLSGGLSRGRLGELARRVLAARSVEDGAAFLETFRMLCEDLGMPEESAFGLTVRVHRGGGLLKDAAYLRGLLRLVAHLQAGGEIEPLLVGKMALHDIPAIITLLEAGRLEPPRLRPHWMDGHAGQRLADLRAFDDPLQPLLAA